MGVQNFVFFSADDWPTVPALNDLLVQSKIPLTLPNDWNVKAEPLHLIQAESEGRPCVFDYACAPYQATDWDWSEADARTLENMSRVAMFNAHSNAQEILGLMAASSALTVFTKGVMHSPAFADGLLASGEAMPLLNQHLSSILAQFNGPSRVRRQ